MELHDIKRYIHDEAAAGRPVESIVMSLSTHDAIRDELRGVAFGGDRKDARITTLFGLPVEIE